MSYKLIIIFFITILCICSGACKKAFLEHKPDNALIVPATIEEFQSLLDNDKFMNGSVKQTMGGPNPALLVTAGDEYYALDNNFPNYSLYSRNVYVWHKQDAFGGADFVPDWSVPYRAIFYANLVIDGLQKIDSNIAVDEWRNAMGSALFYRAHTYFQLAQIFTPYFDINAPDAPFGLPLRLKSDINESIQRSSLIETYSRIESDLLRAADLLPDIPVFKTRPSKFAALSMLARFNLTIQDYPSALLFANDALDIKSELLDYNQLSNAVTYPLADNKEIIFKSYINIPPTTELWTPSRARVDSFLYQSYDANDLRRSLYFQQREPGRFSFRGSYESNGFLFTGLAIDELVLIKAECLARMNKIPEALTSLNFLLEHRYKSGTFIPYTLISADETMKLIIEERKKQLLMRGLRWTDLRRLNMDMRFSQTIYRKINGVLISLTPGDLRYTWPIPEDIIGFNPKMIQNPR